MGKRVKMVLYNGIDRSIGEIKESNEDLGKVILRENLKRLKKKNLKECSKYDFITNDKVKSLFKLCIDNQSWFTAISPREFRKFCP